MLSAIAIAGWTVAALLFALCIAFFAQDEDARRAKRRLAEERDTLAEQLHDLKCRQASHEKLANDWRRVVNYSLQRLDAIERARDQSYCEDMGEMVDGLPDPNQRTHRRPTGDRLRRIGRDLKGR